MSVASGPQVSIFDTLGSLIEQRRVSEDEDAVHAGFEQWAMEIPEPGFGTLDFGRYPFQRAWYSDEVANAEEVALKKSNQIGASACSWRWAAWRTDLGETVIYIFPTETHVRTFGDERIEPAIEGSEYLLSRMSSESVRHKALKAIGAGFLHLRGSNSRVGAQSTAAQALVFDERDDLVESNVEQMMRRVRGARASGFTPRIRWLGIPSVPNFGISLIYSQSDRRRWLVKCPKCSHEQPLDFRKNVRWRTKEHGDEIRTFGDDEISDARDVTEAWRCCERCYASIEAEIGNGRWVAEHPDVDLIGFHATQLIVPGCDLRSIVQASRAQAATAVEAFFRNDLGEDYLSGETGLDEATVLAACARGREAVQSDHRRVLKTMGIDVHGEKDYYVRISEQMPDGRRVALAIRQVRTERELFELVEAFGVDFFAVDGNPERRLSKALVAAFPGRGCIVEYGEEEHAKPVEWKPQEHKVRVQRTDAIDATFAGFRSGRNVPLRTPPPSYVEHLIAPRRLLVERPNKKRLKPVVVYEKQTPDDYAHAEVYDLVALEVLRIRGVAQARFAEQGTGRRQSDEAMGITQRGTLDRPSVGYDPGFGGRG